MRKAPNRESLIALKAAHQAVRLARDLSHPHLDVEHVHCESCHAELDWQRFTGTGYVAFCPQCGKPTELPCHLRGFVTTPRKVLTPIPYEYDNQLRYSDLPKVVYAGPDEDWSTPLPLRIFFYLCLIGVVVFFLIITRK